MSARPGRWAAPLGLLILTLLYFAPFLLAGETLAPGDGLAQFFPQRVMIAESLRHGEIPFWNPYAFGGMPLMATIHPGVFFPGNWGFLFLPARLAMDGAVIAAYWLAACGLYAFARASGLSRAAGFLGAVVFAFGGFMMDHLEHLSIVQVVALAPWLLWAIARFADTGRGRFALAVCGVLAGQVLAGHPQMTAYSGLLAAAYALWRAWRLPAGARLRFGLTLGFMGICAVGLTLVQLLPTLDLIQASQRQQISFGQLTKSSVPPASLPTLLFPFLYGAHVPTRLLPTPYWGPVWWIAAEEGYVGLGGLALALVALVALLGRRAGARGAVGFWAGVAAVTLVLALGAFTPLYQVWAALPVVKMMPYASRHLMSFTLAMAMLAAYGLDVLRAADDAARRALRRASGVVFGLIAVAIAAAAVFGTGFAARTQPFLPPGIDLAAALKPWAPAFGLPFAFALAFLGLGLALARSGRPLAAYGLAGLVFADLLFFGTHMGKAGALPRFASELAVAPRQEDGRCLGLPWNPYPYDAADPAYLRGLCYPGLAGLEGRATVNGYDAFLPARFAALLGVGSLGDFSAADPTIWSARHHALDLLGLRELRVDPRLFERLPALRARLAAPRWAPEPGRVDEAGAAGAPVAPVAPVAAVAIYRNPRALPRAWRVSSASVLPAAAVDARVRGEAAFDPAREALLEPPPGSAAPQGRWWPGRASARQASLNRLSVSTEGAGPGLVVVSEGYDPGWRATTASGERLPVYRADGLVMAVAVPAGAVSFELSYEPRRWRAGLLGAAAAALLLACWAVCWLKRRARPSDNKARGWV